MNGCETIQQLNNYGVLLLTSAREQYLKAMIKEAAKPVLIGVGAIHDIAIYHEMAKHVKQVEFYGFKDEPDYGDELGLMFPQRNHSHIYLQERGLSVADLNPIVFEMQGFECEPAKIYDNRPWYVIAGQKGGMKNKRNRKK